MSPNPLIGQSVRLTEVRQPAPPSPPRPVPRSRLPRAVVALLALVGVGALVAVLAGSGVMQPMLEQIRERVSGTSAEGGAEADKKDEYPKLVRDKAGKPVLPPTIALTREEAASLGITPKTIATAQAATKPRPLPAMDGQLAYDPNLLYYVRPRFPGEVAELGQVPRKELVEGGDKAPDQVSGHWKETRAIGPGDLVKGPHGKQEGTLLAVVWSQPLADKKAALIDALIDLRRDRAHLAKLEPGYREGLISEKQFFDAERTVQKDTSAVNAAERALRTWKLSDQEIKAIKDEAVRIEQTKRDPRREKDWARVEVRAARDGVIVEKNTNIGDVVDPVSSPAPLFRIADLSKLEVWVNAREEFRPVLQKLMADDRLQEVEWHLRLLAEPDSPPLKGSVTRIAPSLDPTQRTMLVIGRVENPGRRLLVGQSITATIYVPPGPDLVEIPTAALNEQDGQCLVFVQPDARKWEFSLRRVAVASRFQDVVLVRSALTKEDQADSRRAAARGQRPVESLRPGERVVTQSVPMLTSAVRDLLADEGPGKE